MTIYAGLKRHLPPLGILLGVLLLVFLRSFDPGLTLSVGDASLEVIRNHYRMLPDLFFGPWVAVNGLGIPGSAANLAPGYLFSFLVPYFKYVDVNAIVHLFLLGLSGYFLLHDCTRNRFASLAGGLFLMLQPHVLSHLLPGHVGHFLMIGWTVPAFLYTRRAVLQGGLLNWSLAGISFGLLVAAGQHDVGAFFGIALAAYGIFLVIRSASRRTSAAAWFALAGGVALVVALTVLIAYQALLGDLLKQVGRQQETVNTVQSEAALGPQEKWLWATQWSLPPVETLDAAVPGFFGWGSSDPRNPYRGRVGQTEGWMQHHQGLPNLNDVSPYLGAVAILGILMALVLRRRDPEVWFFAGLGAVALVLSFGKFGPLYRYFYALPGMDNLRNPIKWYYITSLCAGVLAPLGLAEAAAGRLPVRWKAALIAFLPGVAVVAAGSAALAAFRRDPFPFWQQPALAEASAQSLVHAFLIWMVAGVAIFLLLGVPAASRRSRVGMGVALLVLAGELVFVNRHYMPYHAWKNEVDAGPFNAFLRKAVQPSRIRFLRQDGVFHLLKQVASQEGVENADPYASRLPDPFLLLQQKLEPRNPFRFWQLCNVRYVVAPAPLQDPALKPVLTLKAGAASVVVHEYRNTLPRCLWVSSWEILPEREAADRMAQPNFNPGRDALVHNPPPELPAPPEAPGPDAACRITHYEWGRVAAETDSSTHGLVVHLSRFDADVVARVDGRPVPLLKVNALLQACSVPAGRHTVEFTYQPANAGRAMGMIAAGWVLAAVSVLAGVVQVRRRKREQP